MSIASSFLVKLFKDKLITSKQENSELKDEIARLKDENLKLQDEISCVKQENTTLKDENNFLINLADQI